jgi:polar amino acid transport system substrate-binding protein
MKKLFTIVSLVVVTAMALSACGGGGTQAEDLLAQIMERGTLIVSTDPNYEPQSFLNTEGVRPADTKCASDQLTAAEMQGFDVSVAVEIGNRLGVETCFATPSWDLITAGSWADKWDISVGSMTIKPSRQEVLYFTTPYYYYAAVAAVLADSDLDSIDDLSGQAVCMGGATTYEDWANGNLDIPVEDIYFQPPANMTTVPLETDQECAQALAAGRTDFVAYVTAEPVVDSNIANGLPVKKIGEPLYLEKLAIAIDKSASLPTATLLEKLNEIVQAMHDDGTLSALSLEWYGLDLTKAPGE